MKILTIFSSIALLLKEFGIALSIIVLLLFMKVISWTWLAIINKNYKTNCKFFKVMEKIAIIFVEYLDS